MRYLGTLVLLSFFLVVGTSAWSQTATPTPLLEYDSLGGTGSLPGAGWTLNGNGTAVLNAGQGGLVFTDNNGTAGLANDVYYETSGVAADSASGWTVIVRAKKNSDTAVNQGGMIFSHNSTNASEGYVGMSLGRKTSNPRPNRIVLQPNADSANLSENYDLSQWHTFRFVLKSGGIPDYTTNNCGVFVDENASQFHTTANAGLTTDAAGSYFRMGLFAPTQAVQQEVVIDYIRVFGEIMTFATPFPTATPTSLPCSSGLVNCGFETGDLTGWTKTGGGSVATSGSFCGGAWPYEGKYAFWHVVNGSSLSGSLYQVVTAPANAVSVQAGCYARDSDGCQESIGTVTMGIDPTGGTDVAAGTVQWGSDLSMTGTFQPTGSPSVSVTGGSNYTIFIKYSATAGTGGWCFANIDKVSVSTDMLINAARVKNWRQY